MHGCSFNLYNRFVGCKRSTETVSRDGIEVSARDLVIVGVAVCWENRDSYYLTFTSNDPEGIYMMTLKLFFLAHMSQRLK